MCYQSIIVAIQSIHVAIYDQEIEYYQDAGSLLLPCPSSSVHFFPKGNHCSGFLHHGFILPNFEFSLLCSCVCLVSVTWCCFMRFCVADILVVHLPSLMISVLVYLLTLLKPSEACPVWGYYE